MRTWTQLASLALFVPFSTAPNLALAESIEKAGQKDIAMLLDAATGRNSAYRATLIGETQDRVYIEYVTGLHAGSLFSSKLKRVVYWMPRSAITDGQLAQFKDYKKQLPGGSP